MSGERVSGADRAGVRERLSGIGVTVNSMVPAGKAFIIHPAGLGLKNQGRTLVVNRGSFTVLELGYRPFYSRYTLGGHEARRNRNRRHK